MTILTEYDDGVINCGKGVERPAPSAGRESPAAMLGCVNAGRAGGEELRMTPWRLCIASGAPLLAALLVGGCEPEPVTVLVPIERPSEFVRVIVQRGANGQFDPTSAYQIAERQCRLRSLGVVYVMSTDISVDEHMMHFRCRG